MIKMQNLLLFLNGIDAVVRAVGKDTGFQIISISLRTFELGDR